MVKTLSSLVILGVLAAGCGRPAEPASNGPQDGDGATATNTQKANTPAKGGVGETQASAKSGKPDSAANAKVQPTPTEGGPGGTFGLPLEFDIKAPEVPKKIEGPTPPDQLKKK